MTRSRFLALPVPSQSPPTSAPDVPTFPTEPPTEEPTAIPTDGVMQATPEATPITSSPAPAASPDAVTDLAEFAWATKGGDTPFAQATDVTIAPDGNIWVANGEHSQFEIFTPDGQFVESWGDAYGGVAFAPDGSFYVLDSGNKRVQHFSADRQVLHAWGEFGPGEGAFLVTFGGRGSEPGQLDFQGWMTIAPDDSIWVVDGENHRVQQWANDGQVLQAIDLTDAVTYPIAVAVGAQGLLFITDIEGQRVVVLDPSGAVIGQWGEPGDGDGQFQLPSYVVLDGEGNIYVADYGNGVQKFQLQPSLAPSWKSGIARIARSAGGCGW